MIGQDGSVPVEEANAALRQQIARQEFSAEDVERHLTERRRVKEAMLNASEAKTKARKVRAAFGVSSSKYFAKKGRAADISVGSFLFRAVWLQVSNIFLTPADCSGTRAKVEGYLGAEGLGDGASNRRTAA